METRRAIGRARHTGRTAFTLIEVLIVIAVVGILTALLLPALRSARNQTRQTQCASNMKQVALGMAMYWADYDEYLPATIHEEYDLPCALWGQLVARYTHGREVFRCPTLGATVNEDVHYFNYFQLFLTVPFGYNRTYLGHPGRPTPISKVKQPSETILLVDSKNDFSPRGGPQCGWFEIYAPTTGKTKALAFRHSRGGNVAFLDGRVKWSARKPVAGSDRLWDLQ